LLERIPSLRDCRGEIESAIALLSRTFLNDGALYTCGNGGSAADSQHIVGELGKRFLSRRPPSRADIAKFEEACPADVAKLFVSKLQKGVRAHSLVSETGLASAVLNDIGGEYIFAQQVYAWGCPGDVLLGISTSGNARNVVLAVWVARALGMSTIVLTGRDGGDLGRIADIAIRAPPNETPDIQELHVPIYHCICAEVEAVVFERR